MKKSVFTLFITVISAFSTHSQVKIGDNPASIDASAILEMESTNKGLLLPRLTTAQRTAITSPALGLMVFDIDLDRFMVNKASGSHDWESLLDDGLGGGPWDNSDGTPATQISTDINHMGGHVGIGVTNPGAELEVRGLTKLANAANGYHSWFPWSNNWAYISGEGVIFRTTAAMSERMRLTSAGNLGIATNGPAQRLDVNGNIRSRGGIFAEGNSTITANPPGINTNTLGWKIGLWGNAYWMGIAGWTTAIKTGAWVSFYEGFNPANNANATNIDANADIGISAREQNIQFQERTTDISNTRGGFGGVYAKTDGYLYYKNDAADVFDLTGNWIKTGNDIYHKNSGSVGIGVAPNYKLQVYENNASASISTNNESSDATLYLGTPFSGATGAQKTAIIAEGISNWSRAKLHFALENSTGDNSSAANADITDSKMTLLANGNVGIGITNPDGKLHIYEATGTPESGTDGTIVLEHGNSGGASSIVFKSRVNAGSDRGYIEFSDDGSGNGSVAENALLEIGIQNDVPGSVWQDDIALMPSGNVGVNTRAPSERLHVVGNILASGTITSSDKRLKTNIVSISSANEKIMQLNPVFYKKKNTLSSKNYSKSEYGFIAQEFEEVFPELISKTKDTDQLMAIDYTSIIALLTKSIQEQQHTIEKLKLRIQKLEKEK